MKDNKNQVCHLCSNHCPTDKLGCNRGVTYFNHPVDEERMGRNMSGNYESNVINTNEVITNEVITNESSTNESSTNETSTNETSTNDNNTNDLKKETHKRHHHKGDHENHCRNERHGGKCGKHGGFGRIGYDNDKDDDLLSLLAKSNHLLHRQKGGKRGQGKILKILAEHQEINQKELQEILNIESGSMSELVIKLEHKGFITRAKDETDKRMTKLKITELGLNRSKELETSDLEDSKLIYGSLSEQEQGELKALLKKLLIGWEKNFEMLNENGIVLLDKGGHSHSNDSKCHHRSGRKHGNRH